MSKKTVSLFLALCFMALSFAASASDFSSMTDEELYNTINQARAELLVRQHSDEEIICQADGIIIYFNDVTVEKGRGDSWSMTINYTAVNTGDRRRGLMFEKLSINGWEFTSVNGADLEPGHKAKKKISVSSIDTKAEIKSVDEIQDMEFFGYTYDPETHGRITDDIHTRLIRR